MRWIGRLAVVVALTLAVQSPARASAQSPVATSPAGASPAGAGAAGASAESPAGARVSKASASAESPTGDGVPLAGVPVKAVDVRSTGCAEWTFDEDLWRFEAIGDGSLEAMSLSFVAKDGARFTRTVESAETLTTEAGATLLGGTAQVTGVATGFALTSACPGKREGAYAPIPGLGQKRELRETRTPTALVQGADVGATIAMGAALVLAGALLLIVRRNPRGRHRRRVKIRTIMD